MLPDADALVWLLVGGLSVLAYLLKLLTARAYERGLKAKDEARLQELEGIKQIIDLVTRRGPTKD